MKTKAKTKGRVKSTVVSDPMVILTPRNFKRIKNRSKICTAIAIVAIALSVLAFGTYFNNAINLVNVCKKYEKLSDEYNALYEQYEDLYNKTARSGKYIEDCEQQIVSLCEINSELEEQNKSLVASNDEYCDIITRLRKREELFDKYEYAITRSDGSRTDITYEQLKTVEQLCKEKDIDTDLILSICMVESSGTENAKNGSSTARGYGQILSGTGEYVYEKLMKAGNYDHSLAYNGDLNLKMVIEYIDYLDERNSSLYGVIENYRGDPSDLDNYITKLDKYLSTKGKSVAQLSKNK